MTSLGINQPFQPDFQVEITETTPKKPESLQQKPNIPTIITERNTATDRVSTELFNEQAPIMRSRDLIDITITKPSESTTLSKTKNIASEIILDDIEDDVDNVNNLDDIDDTSSVCSDDDGYESAMDDDDLRTITNPQNQMEGENHLEGGAREGERVEEREGERQLEGENDLEGAPRQEGHVEGPQVEGRNEVEMGFTQVNAQPFRVGQGEVNNIAQRQDINSDRTIPPQKILREAIAKAKEQPGFENASVKVNSSLDQELRSDNPNFKVETMINDHGVLLYKVSVDFTVEIKNENDEVITMTLNRTFYSNATNEKEALLGIYNVAKGVKQHATADNISDNALEQKLFTITYARDPQSKSIIGVRSITGDRQVDFTPRSSGKTTFGRDIDAKGQVRLRRAEQGEVDQGQALSKQARLLRSNIEFTDVPILDRLKRQKIEHKSYIDSQAYQANNLNEEFGSLKELLVKDDLLKWIVKNKKTFNTQVENILSGKANPRDLPLSEKMQEYLSLRQEYVKVQPLVEEFNVNQAASEGLKEMRENLRADRPLKPEDLAFINGVKKKMGVDLDSPSDLVALSALIDGIEVKQNAIRQQVGSRDPAGKLVELEGAYAEARVAALKEHQGLFANLGRMQDIQSELMDRKSKLEQMREEIQNVADMPREEAQWKMGLIDEALGKIDQQIKENAKILSIQSPLGKLFDQEIVIPPSVQRIDVSSDPDLVGRDQQA